MDAGDWFGAQSTDGDDDDAPEVIVEVWECNADAIAVFQLCLLAGIGHMDGVHWQGIEPAAIASACLLLRLPRARWPELATDVAWLGRVVAQACNKRDARRVKE